MAQRVMTLTTADSDRSENMPGLSMVNGAWSRNRASLNGQYFDLKYGKTFLKRVPGARRAQLQVMEFGTFQTGRLYLLRGARLKPGTELARANPPTPDRFASKRIGELPSIPSNRLVRPQLERKEMVVCRGF